MMTLMINVMMTGTVVHRDGGGGKGSGKGKGGGDGEGSGCATLSSASIGWKKS